MGTLPTSFVPSTTQLHRLRGAGFSCIVFLTSDSCSLIRLSYKRLLSGTEKFQEGNCFWNSYLRIGQHDTDERKLSHPGRDD